MTRILKFRAWDKKGANGKGILYQFAELDVEGLVKFCWNGTVRNITLFPGYTVDDGVDYKSMIPMQFTGLLDKNGKEIYEGDVVRSEQWKPTTYQVAFDRGAFYIAGKDLYEVANIKYVELFEIVGNIYESPELLKD